MNIFKNKNYIMKPIISSYKRYNIYHISNKNSDSYIYSHRNDKLQLTFMNNQIYIESTKPLYWLHEITNDLYNYGFKIIYEEMSSSLLIDIVKETIDEFINR